MIPVSFTAMKQLKTLVFAIVASVVVIQTSAQSAPTVLLNELTQSPIGYDTKKAVIFMHGWNPDGSGNGYGSPEWAYLTTTTKASLTASDWALVLYHWENAANTGPISWDIPQDVQDADNAAYIGYQFGSSLASVLLSSSPEIREVHLIAHSAGSWLAYNAALNLLRSDPYVVVQVTLLDPYIPESVHVPFITPQSPLDNAMMGDICLSLYADRIIKLENYYANDFPAWDFTKANWPTAGTQDTFVWRSTDENQIIDWGAPSPGADPYLANYDWHAGPVQFYADTVNASMGGVVAPGLSGSGCPFIYTAIP